jgi:hypothetical protein
VRAAAEALPSRPALAAASWACASSTPSPIRRRRSPRSRACSPRAGASSTCSTWRRCSRSRSRSSPGPGWCRSRTCSAIRAITSGRSTWCCCDATGWRTCCASRPAPGHPFAATFAPIFAPFLADAYDSAAATSAFKAIAGSGDRRRTLAALLTSASRLAVAEGQPPVEPLPFHSGRYLQSRLATSFGNAGFAVELSEIVATAVRRPAADDEKTIRYRSLCLGHERLEGALPRRLLAGAPEPPRDGDILVEAGVFAFVARRPA